jgi:hypothetical protein
MDVVDESRADRADTKPKRDDWDEPSWAYPFAGNVRRDLEDDVGDVEDGENGIIVVSGQMKIFFETS